MTSLTLPQPQASALVHGLSALIVVDRPPCWACRVCKGSGYRHTEDADYPCPVCNSSLGVKAGDRLTIVSAAKPPKARKFGDWFVDWNGATPDEERYELVRKQRDGHLDVIPLPLGVPVGSVVVTDCLKFVALGEYVESGCFIGFTNTGDELFVWDADDADEHGFAQPITDLTAEIAWLVDADPGKWALVVTEPEAT